MVDDGSDDASCAVVRRFARSDRRFRLVRQPHGGIVAALNAGLARCRGAFVARLDADDRMAPRRLQLQLRRLQQDPNLAGVGCHVMIRPRGLLSDGLRNYERWLNAIRDPDDVLRERFVECPLAHPSLMFRRAVLTRLAYLARGWPEDYDLILRALHAGHRLGTVPRRLLHWFDGPSRLTRVGAAYRQQRIVACKAHHLGSGFLEGRRRYVLWGYGETGKQLYRALVAEGYRPSHIVELHPGRLHQRIHGAPVIPPAALSELRGQPLVASVAGLQARSEIRRFLSDRGWREGLDFVCAA